MSKQRGWCVIFEMSALDYNIGNERDGDDYIDYTRVDVSFRESEQYDELFPAGRKSSTLQYQGLNTSFLILLLGGGASMIAYFLVP